MTRRTVYLLLIALGIIGSLCVSEGFSQERGETRKEEAKKEGDRPRESGDRDRGRGEGDEIERIAQSIRDRMAEWQKRREDDMKKRLGATDEEWQILKPRIEKVQQAQSSSRSSRFRGMMSMWGGGRGRGGRSSRGGGDSRSSDRDQNREKSEVEKANDALQKLMEEEKPRNAEIKKALEDLRNARKKDAEKLEKARKELQEVVTLKQEAVLVMMRILE